MGFIRNNLLLISGTICGIYIGQNYKVPNIKKVVTDAYQRFREVEEKNRKPGA